MNSGQTVPICLVPELFLVPASLSLVLTKSEDPCSKLNQQNDRFWPTTTVTYKPYTAGGVRTVCLARF